MRKCRIFLAGLDNFKLLVDHNPLVPILNSKGIDDIDNPRIIRLKEKLIAFKFTTEWRKGNDHCIPDALSRSPVSDPDVDDIALEQELTQQLEHRINALLVIEDAHNEEQDFEHVDNTRDLILEEIISASKEDQEYQKLRTHISNGFQGIRKSCDLPENLRPFFKLRPDLSDFKGIALYKNRIIIPRSRRRVMLDRIHMSHQGIVKTLRRARASIFWPGISSDIKNMIDSCNACQENRPSLPPESPMSDPAPTKPFQETACDLFEWAGRKYLVYVDRFSGWIEVRRFGSSPDSMKVIEALMDLFTRFGAPQKLRTDGGLQFASSKTLEFCKRWGVRQVFSAPHYPQSNGLAESAVKAAKKLLQKTNTDEEFQMGMLEMRNTPSSDGRSPSEKVFGFNTRSLVPCLKATPCVQPEPEHVGKSKHEREQEHRPLESGHQVRLQNPCTKKWDRLGIILRRSGRNYVIRFQDTGNIVTRNRRHIIPRRDAGSQYESSARRDNRNHQKRVTFHIPDHPQRRSERIRQKYEKRN